VEAVDVELEDEDVVLPQLELVHHGLPALHEEQCALYHSMWTRYSHNSPWRSGTVAPACIITFSILDTSQATAGDMARTRRSHALSWT
jgi:hypothetical protein